ncbi:PKD domain-containing protein [Marivirga sp.]|uniref:PKD domain-containing protein n=1 Tax=Marivirga sp. TaxID=2018662 RepID=UPI002D7E43E4|nr:PKD domain-containing protein [Marivirga sp.]HET8861068.1 PKD domain-containing protein [Marivirga sp.]
MENLKLFNKWTMLLIALVFTLSCTEEEVPTKGDPPRANAGTDINAFVDSNVTLNGSNSSDPEGEAITFSWELTQRPMGSSAALLNASSERASFIPDEPGDYTATLTVEDPDGNTDTDDVLISAEENQNEAPEAVITDSNNQSIAPENDNSVINVGNTIQFSAANSSDPEGDDLTYLWEVTSIPSNSTPTLANQETVTLDFTPDLEGEYTILLTVDDGNGNQSTAEVTIEAEVSPVILDASISENTTLENVYEDPSLPDYRVVANIDISALLTINPGVTIQFEENLGFNVSSEGSLSAVGTESDSIIFTGLEETRGFWKGLYFSDSENNANELTYCRVSYGGSSEFYSTIGKGNIGIGYFSNTTNLRLNNSLIRDADGRGITLDYRANARFPEFSNNAIRNNNGTAMYISILAAGDLDANTVIENNQIDAVEVFSPSSSTSVSEDANWVALNNDVPYHINANIDVDAELTLDPGVILEFDSDKYMRVTSEGALIAIGNSTNPILFSGINKIRGYWRGLYFNDSNNVLNELTHVTLEYGGSSEISSTIGKSNLGFSYFSGISRVKLNNVISSNSDGHGLSMDYRSDAEFTEFTNNQFINNSLAGIRIDPIQIKYLDAASEYLEGNGSNYIEVYHSTGADIENDATWKNVGAPILVDADVTVVGNLTIEPGVVLEFDSNKGLTVEGSMTAVGTASERIVFTAKTKAPGAWKGIQYFATSDVNNKLQFVDISYGGSSGDGVTKANLSVQDFTRESLVDVQDCQITNSAGYGIGIASGSAITPANFETLNTFSENALGNIFLE